MRLLTLGAAIAIATLVSFDLKAADFYYPPPVAALPVWRLAWRPSPVGGAPVWRRSPLTSLPYAALPKQKLLVHQSRPAVGRLSTRYGVAPPPAPGVSVEPGTSPPPHATCASVWHCDDRGCGWRPACTPHPEFYTDRYGPPRPPAAVAQEPLALKRESVSLEPNAALARPGSPLILLGQRLFFDRRLSRTGKTACGVCHNPNYGFAQPRPVSQLDGGQLGRRNAPSLIYAGVFSRADVGWPLSYA